MAGGPSPRPSLGARTPRTITTPLSTRQGIVKATVVITMANGATYTVTVDHPVVDMQHQMENHTVSALGSPVSTIPGRVSIDLRVQGYATDGSTVYEEPAIPQIPKFASPEAAQEWLDKNTATT